MNTQDIEKFVLFLYQCSSLEINHGTLPEETKMSCSVANFDNRRFLFALHRTCSTFLVSIVVTHSHLTYFQPFKLKLHWIQSPSNFIFGVMFEIHSFGKKSNVNESKLKFIDFIVCRNVPTPQNTRHHHHEGA